MINIHCYSFFSLTRSKPHGCRSLFIATYPRSCSCFSSFSLTCFRPRGYLSLIVATYPSSCSCLSSFSLTRSEPHGYHSLMVTIHPRSRSCHSSLPLTPGHAAVSHRCHLPQVMHLSLILQFHLLQATWMPLTRSVPHGYHSLIVTTHPRSCSCLSSSLAPGHATVFHTSVSLAPSHVDITHSWLPPAPGHAAVSHPSVLLCSCYMDAVHSSLTITPGHAVVSHPSVSFSPSHVDTTSAPFTSGHAAAHSSTQVKLPKLSIQGYNGDLTKWVTFWDAFRSSIHLTQACHTLTKSIIWSFGRILCC